MKKRLPAALLAVCLAVSMAGAVFAAEDTPPLPEPPAAAEEVQAEETPPAAEEPLAEEPAAPEPTEEPTPTPEAAAEPTPEPTPEATAEPAPEPTPMAEPTPEPTEPPTSAPEPTPTATEPPTPEPSAEPTPAPAPTETPEPTLAPTVVPAADVADAPATPETARMFAMESLLELAAPAVQTAVVTSVELADSITADGCLTAKVNDSADKLDGAKYTWYRSKDGTNWEEVTPQICSGSGWNITEGAEHKLNAALDSCVAGVADDERLTYRVDVTGTDGGTVTARYSVPYYIQLQNGSFETPTVKDNGGRLYYPNATKRSHFIQTLDAAQNTENIVWQTTGVAPHWSTGVSGNYIEIVDGTNRNYSDKIYGDRYDASTDANDPSVCYHTQSAYDGDQFAELNCEAYGALYQDVLTVPGSTLHWSLAHRGRAGEDSMALLIAPVSVATQITTILTNASADQTGGSVRDALDKTVEYNGEQVPIRTFMVGGEMTDGNTQWAVHRGDYTVNAGQYVSRFFFLALSCASGDRREGNLLDKVWFSTEAEPPVAGHANLTVNKTILGSLTADELAAARANLTFTVTRSDGETAATIHGADMTPDAADPTKFSYTLQDLPVTNDNGTVHYRYTVTETAYTAPAGLLYLGSRAGVNGDLQEVTGTPQLADITPAENTTTYADFENTYARQTGSLHLTKAVADANLRTEADAVTNTFTVGTLPIGSYTLVYDDGTTETRTLDAPGELTVEIKGVSGVTIENLPVGRYTVTETAHPDLANYYCTTTAAAATAAAQVPSGGTAEVTITNTYAPFRSVTITKQVTGGYGDTRRGFAFTATVDGAAVDRAFITVSGGAAPAADGGFTIPHRGSVTIGHLKPGQTFTVTEETLADYDTSFDDGTAVTVGNAYRGTVGADDTALTCVNNKDGVPPTGLAQDIQPAVWLLALGLACALLRRRKGA